MHRASDVVGLESINLLDVDLVKLEVEAVQVALDAVGSQALGQDNVAAGGTPVKKDLGRSALVLLGNGDNGGVLQLVAASEGRVSLDLDAVLAAQVDEGLALAEGVDLDLVDGGDNGGVVDEALEVGSAEVGDTNRLDLAELLGGFKGTPRLETLLLVVGGGVDQVEVEVVKAKLVERGAEGVEGGLVAVVGIPELGADEDLLAGGASLLQPGADGVAASLLVGVAGGRVDVAVASIEGGSDGILGLLAVGGLVDTEGDLGDFVAVVEGDGADRGDGVALGAAVDDDLLEDLTLRRGLGGDSGGSHGEGCGREGFCVKREREWLVEGVSGCCL